MVDTVLKGTRQLRPFTWDTSSSCFIHPELLVRELSKIVPLQADELQVAQQEFITEELYVIWQSKYVVLNNHLRSDI